MAKPDGQSQPCFEAVDLYLDGEDFGASHQVFARPLTEGWLGGGASVGHRNYEWRLITKWAIQHR